MEGLGVSVSVREVLFEIIVAGYRSPFTRVTYGCCCRIYNHSFFFLGCALVDDAVEGVDGGFY